MQVWLVGVDHSIQWLPAYRSPNHELFALFIDSQIRLLAIDLIAEEFSAEALSRSPTAVEGTLEALAKRGMVRHLYCDPESEERVAEGINDDNARERFWLGRLLESECQRILYVCGDDHVQSFRAKLSAVPCDVSILATNWSAETEGIMAVVRLDAGKDAVRAYVAEQAAQGLAHVIGLVRGDSESIIAAIEGLSEEEGNRITLEGEWTPAQVMSHLNSSLERSLLRLQTMSSGQEWTNPPTTAGQNSTPAASFLALRTQFVEGMAAIIGTLERADETRGLDLTAGHAQFGPFNWLEWAVYSHHVHTTDHIGQLQAARARIGAGK